MKSAVCTAAVAELSLEKSNQPGWLRFAGIIYGLTPWGLAQQLDVSVGAAQVSLGWERVHPSYFCLDPC